MIKLHHVGIVVKDLAAQGQSYQDQLGLTADTEVFHDPIQNVRVQFWKDAGGGSLIELIEPVDANSPAWREAQKGGGLNHLCYETSDFDRTIHEAIEKGAMLTRPVAPAVAFGGRRIAFVYFLDLGLIEFVEEIGRAHV